MDCLRRNLVLAAAGASLTTIRASAQQVYACSVWSEGDCADINQL
jgi:hypothetical protein